MVNVMVGVAGVIVSAVALEAAWTKVYLLEFSPEPLMAYLPTLLVGVAVLVKVSVPAVELAWLSEPTKPVTVPVNAGLFVP